MKVCTTCKKQHDSYQRNGKPAIRCPECRAKTLKWTARWRNTIPHHPCEMCGKPAKIIHRHCSRVCAAQAQARAGLGFARWKGGRSITNTGYVICYIGKGQREFEHRLVMEKKLGRKLLPGENVHHKNGVRTDNRIANLEVWKVRQPYGQRVEDIPHCATCTCSPEKVT